MQIGSYLLANKLILAPMAGISDRPFRELCRQKGAGLAVSEMVSSNPELRHHHRTLLKADFDNETGLRSVQILGTNPQQMAEAAQFNAQRGAHIIDINMGCPAKKVCSVAAGSALLKDELLVTKILNAVVNAVAIPVTLKIRTGWDTDSRNAIAIAKIAEQAGIAALTIHGRTRACKFAGEAEYETIKQVKQAVTIPIIANGDIDCAEKAHAVLTSTGADAIMIGRAAQGNPWLFAEINYFLKTGKTIKKPTVSEIHQTILQHLDALYSFYGNTVGVRMARKHIGWYFKHFNSVDSHTKNRINQAQHPVEQLLLINAAFNFLITDGAAS
ncbi:MAG: tRNA dihydrouridine synthase DusB [Methylococcaceae bacterium]|nr:tRNA dihydrouridine synthase DusB [Methylococcaceae bacterium]MDD1610784.1 tRNA dihydrouridine synthase DusB [Methylococcaceae bacterium]MDD1616966.1 tRNA dihydrouridine synthase DusB [Methylococcaceae bacterium]OYV16361.1 MAG: tRNA-dihydrouridine synthase B [Methylococcaceae bacterium NSP1-2]